MDTLHFNGLDRQWPTWWKVRWDSFSDHVPGSLMVITLMPLWGERMEKGTRLSFSTSLVWTASLEPGNDTAVIKAAGPWVWQQAALNALTGNSSVGLWDGRRFQTGHTLSDCQPTHSDKFVLSRIKRTGCISKNIWLKRLEILTPTSD